MSLESQFDGFCRRARRLLRRQVRLPKINSHSADVCRRVRDAKLTFLKEARLFSLVSICEELNEKGIEGNLVEAGCALGGSAIALASAKGQDRRLTVYDTFEMIPPPGPKDGPDVHARYEVIAGGGAEGHDGDTYYGYLKDIPERVASSFSDFGYAMEDHNVFMKKGLVEDTLIVDEPVCLAHIDVDWHSPVTACLERIVPNLPVGGVIVLDDYLDWSGCRLAADEYFVDSVKRQFDFNTRFGHLVIRRKAAPPA